MVLKILPKENFKILVLIHSDIKYNSNECKEFVIYSFSPNFIVGLLYIYLMYPLLQITRIYSVLVLSYNDGSCSNIPTINCPFHQNTVSFSVSFLYFHHLYMFNITYDFKLLKELINLLKIITYIFFII